VDPGLDSFESVDPDSESGSRGIKFSALKLLKRDLEEQTEGGQIANISHD